MDPAFAGSFFIYTMKAEQQLAAVKNLMQVPGINRPMADALVVLGIIHVWNLKGQHAEQLYRRLNREAGIDYPTTLIDTLQAAITFAEAHS